MKLIEIEAVPDTEGRYRPQADGNASIRLTFESMPLALARSVALLLGEDVTLALKRAARRKKKSR